MGRIACTSSWCRDAVSTLRRGGGFEVEYDDHEEERLIVAEEGL